MDLTKHLKVFLAGRRGPLEGPVKGPLLPRQAVPPASVPGGRHSLGPMELPHSCCSPLRQLRRGARRDSATARVLCVYPPVFLVRGGTPSEPPADNPGVI